jgi:hypothetical protein
MASDKALSVEERFGLFYAQAGPDLAQTGIANITVNGPTQIAAKTIPPSTAAAGVKFEIESEGNFSTGLSAPTAMNFAAYWGPVGSALTGAQLATVAVPAAGLWASASNSGWHLDGTVVFTSATACSCSLRLSWHTGTGVGASVYYFLVGLTSSLTTGVQRDLALAFGYSGAGVTLVSNYCHINRRG